MKTIRKKIKVGISSCLLGEKVRYDGGHRLDRYLKDTLGRSVEWIGVCPEAGCGLPVPREVMHLVGMPQSPRLITVETNIDHTDRMLEWTEKKLDELGKARLSGFVFKSNSPSYGMRSIAVYGKDCFPAGTSPGIFAAALMRRFPALPAEGDDRLKDPRAREEFIERVFAFK